MGGSSAGKPWSARWLLTGAAIGAGMARMLWWPRRQAAVQNGASPADGDDPRLALHRLELVGDLHELPRRVRQSPGRNAERERQHEEHGANHATFIFAFGSGYG